MPDSTYPTFEVHVEIGGVRKPVPGAAVEVRDVTDETDDVTDDTGIIVLDDIEADGNGIVSEGTLPVAVGRKIRFTWVGVKGQTGFAERTTS